MERKTKKRIQQKQKGSFQKEARWLTVSGLAPIGIGIVLALVFWFTR